MTFIDIARGKLKGDIEERYWLLAVVFVTNFDTFRDIQWRGSYTS